MEEQRFDTVTAAESGTPENRDDVERAAEIVAGLGDTGPLRSVAAVIVGFVVLTLGSVLASRLIGLAAPAGGTVGATGAGGAPAPPPALGAELVWANLASRLLVALLAGAATSRAAPGRPYVHALALAGFVTLISVASLLGLRAAGQFGDPAWYPVAMLFVGPAGILLGGRLPRRSRASGAPGGSSRGGASPPGAGGTALVLFGVAVVAAGAGGCSPSHERAMGNSASSDAGAPTGADTADPLRLPGDRNYVTGYETFPDSGSISVVVEIPAGTNDKWEATKTGEALEWEIQDGAPRVVHYLPYPANYGMLPRTLLPAQMGGDGDPLDVLLLGPAVERGEVVTARPVGVLKLLDGGEQDDKILAVGTGGPFAAVTGLDDLRSGFPGALEIVETWFGNYKGPGEMEALGYEDADAALTVIRYAADAFEAWTACGPLADDQGHGPDPFGDEWWSACRRRMEAGT